MSVRIARRATTIASLDRVISERDVSDGRNRVRYVSVSRLDSVREAVEGYRTFMDLARQYADLVVHDTRKSSLAARTEPKKAKGRGI